MPFLLGLIRVIPAIISAFALFFIGVGVTEWWEHRPPNTPNIKVWLFHWSPPDSLAAQRDKALNDLKACHANVSTLDGALKLQNDSLKAVEAEGSRRLAEAEKAVQRARRGSETARKRAGELLSVAPVGEDTCLRWASADEAVVRALK